MLISFQLGELSEAEDALSEANILNNSDPEVWGYLSLVCLKTGRRLEAEQSYKYAIKVWIYWPHTREWLLNNIWYKMFKVCFDGYLYRFFNQLSFDLLKLADVY